MEIKYIGLDGLQYYDKDIKEYIKSKIGDAINDVVICEESYLKFPTIGDSHSLYVDTTKNKTYRWDSQNLHYYVVGSNYEDIKIIDGTT